ncbi:MAG: hypothetical protein U0270_26275 [Labilithrix sp.]
MVRVVVCASVVIASFLAGCSGHDASIADTESKGASNQQLQKKKDGSATGDGKSCSWEQTATYDTCASPNAPIPTYQLGDEFKSIDGCNECECTAKGIMCTVRQCAGGTSGGIAVPPSPPDGTVCTADAKKCPDGSYTSRFGPKCEFAPCGGGPIACDASARICKDGSPAKPLPDSCKQICPEDGDPGDDPGTACPAVIRVCKGNVPPKQLPGSCDQICPEDPVNDPPPVACTDDAMKCPDGSYVGRTGPKCEFAPCPVKK